MAQGDGFIYNNFKERVMEGAFNLASGGDTLKVALLGTYTKDRTHSVYGSISGSEYNTGAGYTSGGNALSGQDVTETSTTGTFDATDLTFTSLGPLTPSHPVYAVMYRTAGSPANELIAGWETSGTAPNGGNWTLQWGVNGIIILTGGE